ncbi:MAG TPA: YciI family protein [Gemmatimonadaceae bacterium]
MRFMIIVKANADSEAGKLPSAEELTEMTKFNEKLMKAGVMLAGEGLLDSSKGARVHFSGGKTKVIDGPFTETKELIAGFWLWNVKSKAEAIEWIKRAPFKDGDIEIRQVFEDADFGSNITPETKALDERIRAEIAKKNAR